VRPVRLVALAVATACVASVAATANAAPVEKAESATLNVWFGGLLSYATPGTNYLKWIKQTVAGFEKATGATVKYTILPQNNDQQVAKIESAFASGSAPDLLMLFTGSYTSAFKDKLTPLGKYVNATPGFYKSLSNWDPGCVNYDCQNGKGTILGVPFGGAGFFLYYNKALFAKAGIKKPPVTFADLLRTCAALKSKGIVPLSYGDQEGYTTVNWLAENLASYLNPAGKTALAASKLKLTDPRVVKSLNQVIQLRTNECVQPDFATTRQVDGPNGFEAGKTAMVELYTSGLPPMRKALGNNLGVTRIPVSGPYKNQMASTSAGSWTIPTGSANPDLAWKFIRYASGSRPQVAVANLIGDPPSYNAASKLMTDPGMRYIATQVNNKANAGLLDVITPQAVALYLYKELQLAFAGKITPTQALEAAQNAWKRGKGP
jgi:raffinose/stachyose/melibiose transport system substrate-binding protein